MATIKLFTSVFPSLQSHGLENEKWLLALAVIPIFPCDGWLVSMDLCLMNLKRDASESSFTRFQFLGKDFIYLLLVLKCQQNCHEASENNLAPADHILCYNAITLSCHCFKSYFLKIKTLQCHGIIGKMRNVHSLEINLEFIITAFIIMYSFGIPVAVTCKRVWL